MVTEIDVEVETDMMMETEMIMAETDMVAAEMTLTKEEGKKMEMDVEESGSISEVINKWDQ